MSAYEFLKQAKQYADEGANEAGQNVPDGWEDVSQHMSNAMSGFASAYDRMATAMDSDKTSDYAQALDDARTAKDEYGEAVHLARVHYVDMGGRWQDISDGTAEAKSLLDLFKALMGSSQQ